MALILVFCLAAGAPADLLVTGQGESLSGELSRIADGILVFRTSMRGQMMVPVTEVTSLSTDSAWAITNTAGTVHIGRFASGGIEVAARGDAAPRWIPLVMADVAAARQIPPGIETGSSGADAVPKWTAEAAAGVRMYTGSEDGAAPHVSLGLRGADSRSAIEFDLGFDIDATGGFPTYFRGRFEAVGITDRPWGPFVQALAERDRNRALDLRTGLTVGVRYAFDGDRASDWFGLAGIGGTLDDWERGDNAGDQWRGADPTRTDADLNLHLELRYSHALWGRGSWDNRLYVLPGLTDFGHFRAGMESSLVYPVTSRLQLRLEMLMGYEQDPVFSSLDRLDTSLGASIQLNF